MPIVSRQGDPATCGHPNTGCASVFVNGKGATRVKVDTAAAIIIGPGSQTVFVEGERLSLNGDSIAGHGKPPHSSPRTANGSPDTFAGTGFIGDPGGTEPKADLVVIDFKSSISIAKTKGASCYPCPWWTDYCNPGGPSNLMPAPPFVTFDYTVVNNGQDTAQPFTMGFWMLPTDAQGGIVGDGGGINLPFVATQVTYADSAVQDFYNNVKLVGEEAIGSLLPGKSFSGQFTLYDLMYVSQEGYNFGAYADIYLEKTKPDDNNSTTLINILINTSC